MRWQSLLITVLLPTLLLLATSGCKQDPADLSTDDTLIVAVSVPPHAWLVQQVASNLPNVEVITVVPPGASPATYQPTDIQVSQLSKARLLFAAGVPFEQGAWAQALSNIKSLRTIDLRTGIELRDMESHSHDDHADSADDGHDEHDHNDELLGKDPHTWLAPSNLRVQADAIARALAELDPANADAYQQNALAVASELVTLDTDLVELLRPYRDRSFFVFHPAWGYFADAYGLNQIAIEIEGKNPTDRELTELQRMATETGTKTIFVQPQIAGFAAEAVATTIGGSVKRIDPLEPNVLDNLRAVANAIIASFDEAGG